LPASKCVAPMTQLFFCVTALWHLCDISVTRRPSSEYDRSEVLWKKWSAVVLLFFFLFKSKHLCQSSLGMFRNLFWKICFDHFLFQLAKWQQKTLKKCWLIRLELWKTGFWMKKCFSNCQSWFSTFSKLLIALKCKVR